MSKVVEIRIAELFVGNEDHVVTTNGVGSCLVIVLHDALAKVGGMAHAILPKERPGDRSTHFRPDKDGKRFVKYVDKAIDELIEGIEAQGGVREHLVAKLVGGAHMFPLLDSETKGIGWENTEVARTKLKELNIPIETEVVGGTSGRNVRFDCATGVVEITTKV